MSDPLMVDASLQKYTMALPSVKVFASVMISLGVLCLVSGLSIGSCVIQIAAGGLMHAACESPASFSSAVKSLSPRMCCGSGFRAIETLCGVGIFIALAEVLWQSIFFSVQFTLTGRSYYSSYGGSYSYSPRCCEVTSGSSSASCTPGYSTSVCVSNYYDTFFTPSYLVGHAICTFFVNLAFFGGAMSLLRSLRESNSATLTSPKSAGDSFFPPPTVGGASERSPLAPSAPPSYNGYSGGEQQQFKGGMM